jgi:hypothetical protein
VSVLDNLLTRARVFAVQWRDQDGINATVLDELADAVEAFDKAGSVELICPACGADYAEAEKSNALFKSWRDIPARPDGQPRLPWRSDCGHLIEQLCSFCVSDKAAEAKP